MKDKLNLIIKTLPILSVLVVVLLLLVYVGRGEAYRTYSVYQFDKMSALGETLQNSIETFVKAGIPLNQFAGFKTLAAPLFSSEKAVIGIQVSDENGKVVFSHTRSGDGADLQGDNGYKPLATQDKGKKYTLEENKQYHKIILPLRNKFEAVGNLSIITPKDVVAQKISLEFKTAYISLIAIAALYAFFLFITENKWKLKWRLWLTSSFSLAFLLMMGIVIFMLINIYSEGIQGKTQALAQSLAQRLDVAVDLGLNPKEFGDLNILLKEYTVLNNDISYIAIVEKGSVLIHTNKNMEGNTLKASPNLFEYYIPLMSLGQPVNKDEFGISIGIAKKVIYNKLWRNIKNFLALFIALGFIASLFLNLIISFRQKQADANGNANTVQNDLEISLIRPIYFLAVFGEGSIASFLPQYFQKISVASNMSASSTSILFTIYFLVFTLTLYPAGRFAEKIGTKKLIAGGFVFYSIAMLLLALAGNYYLLFFVRAIAAAGQAMILVGVQSYILKVASSGRKTQGASLIVFGYNGGMIAGTALGALVVNYIDINGVFICGAIIALLSFFYVAFLVSGEESTNHVNAELSPSKGQFFRNIKTVLKDFKFIKSVFLVGISTKMILSGLMVFALPLVLSRWNYVQEDIGQILMFYSGGVLLSSIYSSRLTDKLGKTKKILFCGMLGSGIGLALIGLVKWGPLANIAIPYLTTYILIAGVCILGLAHGFINAPIITHVANTKSADSLGQGTLTSLYRLLERVGHMFGPVVFSQILLWNSQTSFVFVIIGAVVMVLGILFAINLRNGFGTDKNNSASFGA